MCGIVGYLSSHNHGNPKEIISVMSSRITHRGPDDFGFWLDQQVELALGHQRLSIIDLTRAGHQPMISQSGRFVLIFNGEIYNHLSLRKNLNHFDWCGYSDTETLLACIDTWGLHKAISLSQGMFAFALWDKINKKLFLVRDRLGEKPLYYGWQNGVLLFGSELKSLQVHPDFNAEINRASIALLLRYGYIPTPHSIYKDIFKLPPGCCLEIDYHSPIDSPLNPVPYWSMKTAAEEGSADTLDCSDAEAVSLLEEKLTQSVHSQMHADVPLGAFLSGGIDSTTIVSLMQAQSSRPVRTFSIGFDESAYNEAEHAKQVANFLGTSHTELYLTSRKALDVIPKLPDLYDEPFSDSSQIPTFLVSEMTSHHVTVALSGDGGDELFGGYNRYLLPRSILMRIYQYPKPFRSMLRKLLVSIAPSSWDLFLSAISIVLPKSLNLAQSGDKLHKFARLLSSSSKEEIYSGLVSQWSHPDQVVIGAAEPPTLPTLESSWPNLKDFESKMMAIDAMTYLPDDILVKVDRAAMAVSLETRVPFLDHRLVEFAYQIPLHMKIRNSTAKWLLREVLHKYVPRKIMDRPKMGFAVPLEDWLRGPLRDWGESLLSKSRLNEEGFLRPDPIREKWTQHISGKRNWHHQLWSVLMFQAWLEKN
jgi:asparagine synthase (glutamine-hydrolysing)